MMYELFHQIFEYLLPIDILVVHVAMAIRILLHLSKAKKKAHEKNEEFDWTYYRDDNMLQWAVAYLGIWVLLWTVPEVIINLIDPKYWGQGVVLLIGFSSKEIVEFLISTVPAALKAWKSKYLRF